MCSKTPAHLHTPEQKKVVSDFDKLIGDIVKKTCNTPSGYHCNTPDGLCINHRACNEADKCLRPNKKESWKMTNEELLRSLISVRDLLDDDPEDAGMGLDQIIEDLQEQVDQDDADTSSDQENPLPDIL